MTDIKDVKKQITELREREYALEKPLGEVREQLEQLFREREKLVRAQVPFTDEQLNEVAKKLSKKQVYIFFDEDSKDDECEDDGSIHVTRMGVRFCKDGKESELPAFAKHVEKELNKLKAILLENDN